jgi:hypothetical protein
LILQFAFSTLIVISSEHFSRALHEKSAVEKPAFLAAVSAAPLEPPRETL